MSGITGGPVPDYLVHDHATQENPEGRQVIDNAVSVPCVADARERIPEVVYPVEAQIRGQAVVDAQESSGERRQVQGKKTESASRVPRLELPEPWKSQGVQGHCPDILILLRGNAEPVTQGDHGGHIEVPQLLLTHLRLDLEDLSGVVGTRFRRPHPGELL